MRIVGGALRGRMLKAPQSQAIRPTSDRLRESLFDILQHAYDDAAANAVVVDLFAGAGALGFEALSRGAARALFVDDGAEARALLRANVESLGVGGVTRIFRRDATKLGRAPAGEAFTLALLDPPYRLGLGERALTSLIDGGWLAPGALIVLEEAASAKIGDCAGAALLETRRYGETQFNFYRREG